MELKSGATFDAKIRDVDEKADIALIKIDAPVSSLRSMEMFTSSDPPGSNLDVSTLIVFCSETEPLQLFNKVQMRSKLCKNELFLL